MDAFLDRHFYLVLTTTTVAVMSLWAAVFVA
jgi:hypothetical protein